MACLASENTRDDGLRGDDRRQRGRISSGTSNISAPIVERVAHGFAVHQHMGALAVIVEQQGRHGDEQPGAGDDRPAEMAEIGIERLAAGNGQEGGAEK